MGSTSKSSATRARRNVRSPAFPVEFRLRIVKLFPEEGYRARLLVDQFGVSAQSIQRWVRAYRLHGTAGLEPKVPAGPISRVPEQVR
jgi:transposase-like protein